MLSDAAGEDEKIHAAQQGHVSANHFAHGDRKDIQRQGGFPVIVIGTGDPGAVK